MCKQWFWKKNSQTQKSFRPIFIHMLVQLIKKMEKYL